MSDALKRAIRTAIQAGIGTFVLLVIPFLNEVLQWASGNVTDFPDISVIGKALVAFLAGAFISLLTWLQNFGEDAGKIPTLLKDTRASTNLRTAVQSERGAVNSGTLIVATFVLVVVILIVLLVR